MQVTLNICQGETPVQVLDLNTDNAFGRIILRAYARQFPDIPALAQAAYPDGETVIERMRLYGRAPYLLTRYKDGHVDLRCPAENAAYDDVLGLTDIESWRKLDEDEAEKNRLLGHEVLLVESAIRAVRPESLAGLSEGEIRARWLALYAALECVGVMGHVCGEPFKDAFWKYAIPALDDLAAEYGLPPIAPWFAGVV